jgi:hypothetical protein
VFERLEAGSDVPLRNTESPSKSAECQKSWPINYKMNKSPLRVDDFCMDSSAIAGAILRRNGHRRILRLHAHHSKNKKHTRILPS